MVVGLGWFVTILVYLNPFGLAWTNWSNYKDKKMTCVIKKYVNTLGFWKEIIFCAKTFWESTLFRWNWSTRWVKEGLFSLGYLVYNMRLRAGSTSVKIAMWGRGWVYGGHMHHMQRHRLHIFFLPCEMSSSMALTLFAIELTNDMFFQ